ncbi:MAG: PKD domain-containing protein, partial [Bacteroidia bacterium]|nr:PKD domain-containing protein [Bacteroidia bacterium]
NNLLRYFSYNYSGTYVVKLIALSSNYCTDTATQLVIVADKATPVNFAINKTAQCLSNNNFIFTNQSTPNNSSLKYKWDFGNGDTSTLLSPNYHYNTLGGTSVKLVVTANNECLDSITKNISVNAEAVANFTINDTAQCLTGNSFGFTNSATNSNTQTWSFGDASNSTVLNPTKTYTNAGSFAVKLVAKNNSNCNDSITKTVLVYPSANLSFGINNASQCLKNNAFNFTNTSSISSDTATYKWVLGEADTTTNTSKTFSQIGNYKIYLLSSTNQNCDDTFSKDIIVKASPTIGNITGNVAPNSISTPFAYSVLSQANSTYNWTTTGTIQSGQGTNAVNIIWTNLGSGSLMAKITNNNGCIDSTILPINISVGINNLSLDNDLNIYPNPTKTSITITNKTNLAGKKYIITNIVGQIVISGKLNLDETIVNLETLQSGVYLLSIDGMNKQSIKVIKE